MIQKVKDNPEVSEEREDYLTTLRHSTAHVMAQAVKELFPGVKLAIGPPIEDGFYYDFDYEGTFSEEDLPRIEERMREIVRRNLPFVRQEMGREEAIRFFEERGEDYKVEILRGIDDEKVTLYWQGDFVDLCRGPHVPSTGEVKAFKLLSVAGAYWRGDEHNKMLQRIYGTAFPTEEELERFLHRLEEAKRRDHRKLGKELDLFGFYEEAGPGLVIYHHKGALIRSLLEELSRREHLKRGYQLVIGPHILKAELWKRSGHYDYYREHMYFTEVEGQEYALKPMNCLAHILVYRSRQRSYRELPLRFFELGTVHRHERSGVLHGLLRAREFTQDDAHIFCRSDQLHEEIREILHFVQEMMELFGFSYEVEVSTRPEKYIGSDEDWERATRSLVEVLEQEGLPYQVNEGEGAFYGPKIDIKLKDALGRKWQCATIQCDFSLPERFSLEYVGSDGERHRPVMIHRVIFGAMERFIGVLVEHFAGAFPLWLSPVQVKVLTITDRHIPYGEKVLEELLSRDIRAEGDFRNEKLGYKVREAQLEKIPYMLVVGDKEVEAGTVTPRERSGKNLGAMKLEEFIEMILPQCRLPSLKGGERR
ncbi:MAG: threonine--tRNA ligase [Deltaproteobacteria bacterium]|nr:MAG: threonine--tRNA ligase [Deltaproteobacteria bacterium]